MTKLQLRALAILGLLWCGACGGTAEKHLKSGNSMDDHSGGSAGVTSAGGSGGGSGGRAAGQTGGTAGTGGVFNPCPQSSWVVESCFTPEVAWAQWGGAGGTGGEGGSPTEGGAAGEAGQGDAARDECPPAPASYQYMFGSYGPVIKDGNCCYGYMQICG